MPEVTLIARPEIDPEGLRSMLERGREDQFRGRDADILIEAAGRICYDSPGRGRSSADYAAHILEVGHGSVLEHAQFSFLIRGISRNCSHEWVRHRVGIAISQRSTRYCDESRSPHVWHPLWRAAVENPMRVAEAGPGWGPELAALQEELEAHEAKARELYRRQAALLESVLKSQGVDKLAARKQARGAARQTLLTCLETEMVWSANVRTLRHFFDMRACQFADAEIREVAMMMHRIMAEELPAFFSDYTETASPDGCGPGLMR